MTGPAPATDPAALGPDEQVLGGNPRSRAANEVLRALSRAARAFTLYDAKNLIMLRFLADYRAAVDAALGTHGELPLLVGPFEFLLGSDVVYREKDRERSLAFRLFRDGVRTLTLRPGFTWDEGVRLLELVSLRFAGARQREDDVVTLLRKAAFEHLAFTAAEGFVPSEEHPEPDDAPDALQAAPRVAVQAPPDFDLPLAPSAAVGFTWREVPERYLLALRAEESPAGVRHAALALTAELLTAANGPASELSNAELIPLVTEVRDACLADGAADSLLELAHVISAQHGIGHEALGPVLGAVRSPENLAQLLEALPADLAAPPPALVELLLTVGGEPVSVIAARLRELEDPGQQRVLEELLLALARRQPELVLPQLHLLDKRASARLVAEMMNAHPEQGLVIAARLAQGAEPASHLEALDLLQHAPRSEQQSSLLLRFAASPDDAVFARAAQVLALLHDAKAFEVLVKQAELRATADTFTRESATAVGEALVTLSPRRALALLRPWAHPRAGFLARLVHPPHERWLQKVAISGIGLVAGTEAEAEVRAIAEHTTDEVLKRYCLATLARRRRAGAAGGQTHG